jgi:hypothetical protein
MGMGVSQKDLELPAPVREEMTLLDVAGLARLLIEDVAAKRSRIGRGVYCDPLASAQ